MTNQKFRFGDKVMWKGMKAVVICPTGESHGFKEGYVGVAFKENTNVWFESISELKRGWK